MPPFICFSVSQYSLQQQAVYRLVQLTGLLLCVLLASNAHAKTVRVGLLKYGTVNWEMDVIQHHDLAESAGITIEIVPLSSNQALNTALQGKRVDVVVNDWIWVSRQRAEGRNYTAFPYSLAIGSLLVHPDAGIASLSDLEGRRLGVAGGPVDKSWLLLRAYSRHLLGQDLMEMVDTTFASPPLLDQLMLRGDIPAAVNYWHHNVRLQAAGMTVLMDMNDVLAGLGINQAVPMLVWVFSESWAEQNRELVEKFLEVSFAAKQKLAQSDAEWQRIKNLVKADDETLKALRIAYRNGIPQKFDQTDQEAAAKVFALLAKEGGRRLVGRSDAISPGTFWPHYIIDQAPQ